MNNYKSFSRALKTTFFSILVFPLAVNAQDMQRKTPAERAQMQTEWMSKNLSLTTDQLAKVTAINALYAQKGDSLMSASSSMDRADKMKMRQQMMSDKDSEIKAVLTADQFQKYQAQQAEMREKMKNRMQGGGN